MLNAHRGRNTLLAFVSLITLSVVAAGQDRSVVTGKRVGVLRLLQHVTKVPDSPEAVIRSFWQGLGELDFEKMKSVIDLPLTLIEVSENNSRASKVFRNTAELDEEFKQAPASAVEKHRSEFYGTKLLAFRVTMLSPNLASVSYSYRLPHELVVRNPQRKDKLFTGLTLMRRDGKEGNRWRIVLITIPA